MVDGYKLGWWVNMQRNNHAEGTLDADRQRRLQDLPGWAWDARADQWEEGFRRLSQYVEQHGDAHVPQSYTVEGYKLGQWVTTQRSRHAEGTLDADREHRLQDVPGWTWDPIADKWEEGFSRLQDYVKGHGDARVLRSYTVDGYRLGAWINSQRTDHARGTLDADRQHRLEDLPGWTWDPYADRWEEEFSRLLHYIDGHGDARVPQSYTDDGYRLGAWVTTQRQTHRKGTLDADRQRRLQDLPGWTWKASSST